MVYTVTQHWYTDYMTKVRESGIRFITLIYNKHGTHVWKKTGLGQENTALSCQLCSSIKSLSPMSHCSECLKLAIKLISTMQSTELIGHTLEFLFGQSIANKSNQLQPQKYLDISFKKKSQFNQSTNGHFPLLCFSPAWRYIFQTFQYPLQTWRFFPTFKMIQA